MNQQLLSLKVGGVILTIILIIFDMLMYENKKTVRLEIKPLAINLIADGIHTGGYVFHNNLIKAEVTVKEGKITDIQFGKITGGETAGSTAVAVAGEVMKKQKLEIPIDEHENLKEKAFKKAVLISISNALNDKPLPEKGNPETWPGYTMSVSSYLYFVAVLLFGYSARAQIGVFMARTAGDYEKEGWYNLSGVVTFGIALLLFIVGLVLSLFF